MFDRLLPSNVSCHAVDGDLEATLFQAEHDAIANAVEKRRREFTTGRACARAALSRLGLDPQPIPPGPDGSPRWPEGVIGSITHCVGHRAAAVAWASELATVGIDAELDQPLPEGVLMDIASVAEREQLRRLAVDRPSISWDRLLFSAKESVYKAWYPLTGRWLGFEDAEVAVDPERGSFTATLLVPGPVVGGRPQPGFAGRWAAAEGLVFTTIALPATGSGPDREAPRKSGE